MTQRIRPGLEMFLRQLREEEERRVQREYDAETRACAEEKSDHQGWR
jgi:hypothetical protein